MVGAEAARRFAAAGSSLVSVIAHPGYALGGRGPVGPGINEPTVKERIVDTLQASFSQTKELGAHALVRAAVDPAVAGGQFVGPKGYKGPTQIGEAPKYTTDQAAADRLWEAPGEGHRRHLAVADRPAATVDPCPSRTATAPTSPSA